MTIVCGNNVFFFFNLLFIVNLNAIGWPVFGVLSQSNVESYILRDLVIILLQIKNKSYQFNWQEQVRYVYFLLGYIIAFAFWFGIRID